MNASSNKKSSVKSNGVLLLLILVVLILWIGYALIIPSYFVQIDERGAFGDSFGAISSLFAGLALAGVIFSIYLQRVELSIQREELKNSIEELRRTAEANETSSELMKEQIRLNIHPQFDYSPENSFATKRYGIKINNISDNYAFDVRIQKFMIFRIDDKWITDLSDNIDTNEIENNLIDDQLWSIEELGYYYTFPTKHHIYIPLKNELDCHHIDIYMQYRDSNENNYLQRLILTLDDDSMSLNKKNVIHQPKSPKQSKRIEKYGRLETDKLSKVEQSLVDISKCSIHKSKITDTQKNVEHYWKLLKT